MRRHRRIVIALCLGVLFASVGWAEPTIELPRVVLDAIPFEVSLSGLEAERAELLVGEARHEIAADGDGTAVVEVVAARGDRIELRVGGVAVATAEPTVISGWWSIAPPLVAIAAAVLLRSVVPALFLGIWVGGWAAAGLGVPGLMKGLLDTVEIYALGAIVSSDHAAIVLFTFLISGMVGIVSRNGGMAGVVARVTPWAGTARRAQLATAGLGTAIFFDDYANTLVIGNSMRSVTDGVRVSREKLAFLVDATAAPVACVALVTTWIGYEIGILRDALARIDGFTDGAYLVFLRSLGYSFYPWLMLVFVFVIAGSGRDFSAMHRAELRARRNGNLDDAGAALPSVEALDASPDAPRRAANAAVPVATLIGGVIAGLWATGEGDTVQEIIGSADSYKALMWGSLVSVVVSVAMTLGQRILDLRETVDAWYSGVRASLLAMIVLILAWALGNVTEALHTSDFLVSLMGDRLPAAILPTLIFVLAAGTAFATGTSWGTMGILLPLVVPLTWAAVVASGDVSGHIHILYSGVACVLTGSVWGDHCSPISDTTVLSSMASGCDHLAHVSTQLPYALVVGGSALVLGTLPAGFGLHWALCLAIGAAAVVTVPFVFGRPVDA